MSEIRGLSVKQPWSWAIAIGEKRVENRSRSTKYRGLVAVHASKAVDKAALDDPRILEAIADREFVIDEAASKTGAIVAVAEITGSHPDWTCIKREAPDKFTACWKWGTNAGDGQHHWLLANIRPLAQPVPCRGMLGLWRLPEDVERSVLAQLERRGEGLDILPSPEAGDSSYATERPSC